MAGKSKAVSVPAATSHAAPMVEMVRKIDRYDDEADLDDIIGLGTMLVILLAQPDAETALNGMRRTALTIVERARACLDRNGRCVSRGH